MKNVFFCALENEKKVGFLYLKPTGKDTVEIAVMGVLKEYHRKGKMSIWSFAFLSDETRYVFRVPKGTISREIALK